MLTQTEQTQKQNLPREQAKLVAAIAVVVSPLPHAIHRCQESKTGSASSSTGNAGDSLEGVMDLDWANLPPLRGAPPILAGGLPLAGMAQESESPAVALEPAPSEGDYVWEDDSDGVDPSASSSIRIALISAGSTRDKEEDGCSNVADEGDWTDEEMNSGSIHVRLSTAGGALVGAAVVDADATVGQLVARLDRFPEWHARYDHFVVENTVFGLSDHGVRFTRTEVVKGAIVRDARGDRVLHAHVVASAV